MAEIQQKITIKIPKVTDVQEVGNQIIDFIINRTLSNRDVNNRRFANYSDSYAASKTFKIAGKQQDNPNLKLSAEMHNALQILGYSDSHITIGFEEDTAANNKAKWAKNADNGPVREFLGITSSDVNRIAKPFLQRDTPIEFLDGVSAVIDESLSIDDIVSNFSIEDLISFGIEDNEN